MPNFRLIAVIFCIVISVGYAQAGAADQTARKIFVGKIVSIDSKLGDIVVQSDNRKVKVCDVYHYFGNVSEYLQVSVDGADFSARLKNFKDFKIGDTVEIVYEEGKSEIISMKRQKSQKSQSVEKSPTGCDLGGGAIAEPGLIEKDPFTGEGRECVKKGNQYIWVKIKK